LRALAGRAVTEEGGCVAVGADEAAVPIVVVADVLIGLVDGCVFVCGDGVVRWARDVGHLESTALF